MAEFDVVSHYNAVGIIFQLPLSFLRSSYFKYVVIDAEISILRSDNVVIDTHLVVEESLTDTAYIGITTLQSIHKIGIVDEYLLYLSQAS